MAESHFKDIFGESDSSDDEAEKKTGGGKAGGEELENLFNLDDDSDDDSDDGAVRSLPISPRSHLRRKHTMTATSLGCLASDVAQAHGVAAEEGARRQLEEQEEVFRADEALAAGRRRRAEA